MDKSHRATLLQAFDRGWHMEQAGDSPLYDAARAAGRSALTQEVVAALDALTIAVSADTAKYGSHVRVETWAVLWMLSCALSHDTLEYSDITWQMHRLTWDDSSPLEIADVQRWRSKWT